MPYHTIWQQWRMMMNTGIDSLCELTSALAPASSRGALTRWYLSRGMDPCLAIVGSRYTIQVLTHKLIFQDVHNHQLLVKVAVT
eukprot:1137908-Pelagomonas_calceolata.AAC.1